MVHGVAISRSSNNYISLINIHPWIGGCLHFSSFNLASSHFHQNLITSKANCPLITMKFIFILNLAFGLFVHYFVMSSRVRNYMCSPQITRSKMDLNFSQTREFSW